MGRIGAMLAIGGLLAAAQADGAADATPTVRPEFEPVEEQAGLPRVLLIGDSISMGYTVPVRELLAGKANVLRPHANCGPTLRGLEALDAWLGEGPWDAIHFNFGLHDLKHVGDKGDDEDPRWVPPAEYEQNLERIVTRLAQTGATLIWCSTTPVPEGAGSRTPGDEVTYNAIAARVMRRHGVAIDDLYAYALSHLAEWQMPANVHFTKEGSLALATQVAASIEGALGKRKTAER